jgi:hypothetical protein
VMGDVVITSTRNGEMPAFVATPSGTSPGW